MEKRELTAAVKRKANELGFAAVGITRAEELTEEGARLRRWLARGFHGTMEWMARNAEKRIDPRKILDGARSVICVATNYYTPARHRDSPGIGKISRYAWGDDYHLVMTPRILTLLGCIKSLVPNAEARVYVDTGPVMEKAWAVRAGIGWLGKHTNVITRNLGSWVFLGEIITDVEFEYDDPIADFCGTCRACIDACPTDAIVEPYVLDSTRCISYLTIEHRGELPPELLSGFENWVYGCDICQDVCPWNNFQKESSEPAFQPRPENLAPELEGLERLTEEEFAQRFRRSPVKRTKLQGLRRNVEAVLRAGQSERAK